MLSARKAVLQMHEYHPPLAGRRGLRLDFNENTEGCSPRVLARMREITAEELARYPEREPVEASVAAYLGLPAEQVLLTNGVDEAIHLLCEAYLEPSDEVIVVTPTFGMYEIFAEATGAKVVRVQCGEDLRFPIEQALAAITPATRLIAIASPNNPTGGVASREQLLAIPRRRRSRPCWSTRPTTSFTARLLSPTSSDNETCLLHAPSPRHTGWRACASVSWPGHWSRCQWCDACRLLIA